MNFRSIAMCVGSTMILCVTADRPAEAGSRWAKAAIGSASDMWVSVDQTSDGGCIMAGFTYSFGAGSADAWCVKLDSAGNPVWQKTYGGSGSDYFNSVRQTSDGGYIAVGFTSSFGAGAGDGWCLKLDSAGNTTWRKTYGGGGSDWLGCVHQMSDGGYVVAGYTMSSGFGSADAWCLRLDGSGNTSWQKTFGLGEDDVFVSVQQTSDGGCVVAGYTKSFGAGGRDVWCVKLDGSGSLAWQKTYGGALDDVGLSVAQTRDGGYVLAGYTHSFGAGIYDGWCLKLDASGNPSWQKIYGGSAIDIFSSVAQASDGGYIVTGVTNSFGAGLSDGWCLKLDSSGNPSWQKTYGNAGDDGLRAAAQTGDGGSIMAGESSSFGAGSMDAWCLKLDSGGGDIDSSCGTLVQSSAAVISNSGVAGPAAVAIESNTFVVGMPSGGGATDSSATMALICASSPASADLTGTWSNLKVTGSRVTATLSCVDAGSADAGQFVVKVYLAKKPTAGKKATLVETITVGPLPAGGSSSFKVKTTKGNKHKYIVAVIDSDNSVAEDDELDNVAIGKL
ncbi:MAG: hypothetical protein HYX75_00495 [Acidobacteria bacterium]|nr:hypothetical protein [Acidobacteriota bacterium]